MDQRNNEKNGNKGFFNKAKRIPLYMDVYTIVDIQDGVSEKGVETVSFILQSQTGQRIPKIYYATKKGIEWLQKDLQILFGDRYNVTDLESDDIREEILRCQYTCNISITWTDKNGMKFRNIYFQGSAVMSISCKIDNHDDTDYFIEYMEDDEHVDDVF